MQLSELLSSSTALGFGRSVDMDKSNAVVGAPMDNSNLFWAGSAYVFDVTSGMLQRQLFPLDAAIAHSFGESVAVSGTTVIVGAIGDSANGPSSGAAYLFDAEDGRQLTKLLPTGGGTRFYFGCSVDIDGSVVVAGAKNEDTTNGGNTGAAYSFRSHRASAVAHNGSGLNATILTNDTLPTLGGTWTTSLDCAGHTPSLAVLVVHVSPASGLFLRGGEVLIDFTSPRVAVASKAHSGNVVSFSFPIPNDSALCGPSVAVQAAVFGAPRYELSNGFALTLGL